MKLNKEIPTSYGDAIFRKEIRYCCIHESTYKRVVKQAKKTRDMFELMYKHEWKNPYLFLKNRND